MRPTGAFATTADNSPRAPSPGRGRPIAATVRDIFDQTIKAAQQRALAREQAETALMHHPITPPGDRPAIHLYAAECDALFSLALSAEPRQPQACAMLLAELDRAHLHEPGGLPAQTVTMNARIEFVDEGSDTRRTVQLVYPHDADIAAGRVSILTPVGAGLIGMAAGASIRWPDRDGHDRVLRIVSVTPPDQA